MVDWLNDNAGFATSVAAFLSFLATVLLVAVTFTYVRHTQRIADAANKPAIYPQLTARGPNLIRLRIVNCGTGPAVNVTVSVSFSGTAARKDWTTPFMAAGEFQDFKFPVGDNGSVESVRRLGQMDFVAEYESVDGRKLRTCRRVDLDRSLHSSTEAHMLVTEDHPERILISIRDELRQIGQAMQRCSSNNDR